MDGVVDVIAGLQGIVEILAGQIAAPHGARPVDVLDDLESLIGVRG